MVGRFAILFGAVTLVVDRGRDDLAGRPFQRRKQDQLPFVERHRGLPSGRKVQRIAYLEDSSRPTGDEVVHGFRGMGTEVIERGQVDEPVAINYASRASGSKLASFTRHLQPEQSVSTG